jgi:hypothetical protein
VAEEEQVGLLLAEVGEIHTLPTQLTLKAVAPVRCATTVPMSAAPMRRGNAHQVVATPVGRTAVHLVEEQVFAQVGAEGEALEQSQ